MRTQSTTPPTPVTPAHRELGCTLVPTSSEFAAGSESSLGVESDLLRGLLPAKKSLLIQLNATNTWKPFCFSQLTTTCRLREKTIILHQLQSFSNFTPEWKIQSTPATAPPAVTISSRSCKLQSAACFSSTHQHHSSSIASLDRNLQPRIWQVQLLSGLRKVWRVQTLMKAISPPNFTVSSFRADWSGKQGLNDIDIEDATSHPSLVPTVNLSANPLQSITEQVKLDFWFCDGTYLWVQ